MVSTTGQLLLRGSDLGRGRQDGDMDLALLVLSFLLLSAEDYFNPALGQIGMTHRPLSGSCLQSVIM